MSDIRTFESGATRSSEEGKLDYEGFLSPIVLERYGRYMNKHSIQADGQYRPSDNWTKGIPRRSYTKSLFRHFVDVWALSRKFLSAAVEQDLEEALCATIFNAMGLLHEVLLGRDAGENTSTKA